MRLRRHLLTRRRLLSASIRAGVGVAALALAGCGDEAQPGPEQADQVRATEPAQADSARPVVQPADERSLSHQLSGQAPAQGGSGVPRSRRGPAEPAPAATQPAGPSPQADLPDPAIRVTRQFAGTGGIDSWDPHRARSSFVQRVHSLTYHRIVRWEQSSSPFIEADLCWLAEIPDIETWVFNVDPRAGWLYDAAGEGRPATSEDVRLSIERLSSAAGAGDEVDEDPRRAADWAAIRFEAAAPFAEYQDPFVLKVDRRYFHALLDIIAAPFSWIASAEAIEQGGVRWPEGSAGEPWSDGSGPYLLHGYELAQTTLVRSDRWWAAQPSPQRSSHRAAERLARLDAIRIFTGPAEDLMRMYAEGDIDAAGSPLDDAQIDALAAQFPEHQVYEVLGGRPLRLVTPRDPDPAGALSDPRIATAINWSLNRPELVRWALPVRLRPSGPVAPQFTWLALEEGELSGYFGYRPPDPATRAAVADLVGAAGGADQIAPLKLVVFDNVARDLPGLDELVSGTVGQTTGLAIEVEHAERADAMRRLRNGERFAYLRWGEMPQSPLPVRDWLATQHTEGPGAWGAFTDPGLDRSLEDLREHADVRGDLREAGLELQQRWLSGAAAAWIHELAVPVQRVIAQPWFSPDARWLDYAWSDQHLADCGIRLRDGSGYPADRRPLPGSDSDSETS